MPWPKSSISLSITSLRPSTLATPSPISRMTPTFCSGRGRFRAGDLRFDFLYQVSHVVLSLTVRHSQARFERGQPGSHAAVVHVAADLGCACRR